MDSTVNLNKMINGVMSEIWARKSIDSTMVGACHVFTAGAQAAARKIGEEVSDCAAAMLFYDYMVSLGYSKRDIYNISGSDTLLPAPKPVSPEVLGSLPDLAQQMRDLHERSTPSGGATYPYGDRYDPFLDDEEKN